MSKNIEMNYKIDSGYEAIYPNVMLVNVGDFNSYMDQNYYNQEEIDQTVIKMKEEYQGI